MTVEVQQSREPIPELSLCLLEERQPLEPRRIFGVGLASVLVNILLLAGVTLLARIEGSPAPPPRRQVDLSKAVPLILPAELTQKAPNKNEVAKDIRLDDLLNRPDVRAQKRVFSPPPAPKPVQAAPTPLPVPEPPQIRTQAPPPALGDTPNIPPPPVQRAAAPPPEKPKLAFETPGSQTAAPSTQPSGMGRIPPPKTSVDDAIKTITRGARGGLVIGDMPDESGVGEALGRSPSPGRQASSLELLSDPMGVDFKPYLIRVLAAVRRNWLAIVPESARLGLRGKVTIQFSIARAGNVPKLVIVTPSGTEGLDRAAVAGISASNPFPPLPTEFRGDQVRLQLAFFYNVPTR